MSDLNKIEQDAIKALRDVMVKHNITFQTTDDDRDCGVLTTELGCVFSIMDDLVPWHLNGMIDKQEQE